MLTALFATPGHFHLRGAVLNTFFSLWGSRRDAVNVTSGAWIDFRAGNLISSDVNHSACAIPLNLIVLRTFKCRTRGGGPLICGTPRAGNSR